jgi:hypothetical protein
MSFGDPWTPPQRRTLTARQAAGRRGIVHHNTLKEECPQGHPYDEENTHIDPRGARRCRACNRAHVAKAKRETLK